MILLLKIDLKYRLNISSLIFLNLMETKSELLFSGKSLNLKTKINLTSKWNRAN
jgi:hypothetical protein